MKYCDGYGHLHEISVFVTKRLPFLLCIVFAMYFFFFFFAIFYNSNISTFGIITNVFKMCFLKYKISYRRDRPFIFDMNFVESYSTFVQRIVS